MGLCELHVERREESSEIENLFTRRAQSHEIMIMLFRAKHMGNTQQHVLCPISQIFSFFFFISSHLRFCRFLRHTPNKSLEVFFLILRFSLGLTCIQVMWIVMPTRDL